jgi:LPXTG-motif cell wall-anchored protein
MEWRDEKMFKTRIKNMFMLFVLLFALLTSGLPAPVYAAEQTEGTITVIGDNETGVLLDKKTYAYSDKLSAFDALLNTVGSSNLEYSESAYGKMISGINGLNASGNYFWAFYINGISAQVGADQYIVQKGDHLSFRYIDWTVDSNQHVALKIVGKDGTVTNDLTSVSFVDEPTAFQLLQAIYGDKLKFSESQYGKMITSIDGLTAEGTYYWAFYVNGQMGSVGADSYKLKVGDQISFQYESWETPSEEPKEESKEETNPDTSATGSIEAATIQKAVELASQYVMKNQIGEWEAIALIQAGKEIPNDYLVNTIQLIKDKQGRFSKITDYERYTLGILAAGGDPTNVAGYNLIESIFNGNVTKQGLNGVFYALIALDSANFEVPNNAKWTREKLINELLEKQNSDNGWSWDGSATSDLDTTAMVVAALAPHQGQNEVKTAIDAAIDYLSATYKAGKVNNSSTAAQIIVALSAIGVDANHVAFTKDGQSLINYLLTYQNVDGGFDWQGGNISDVMSTSQGIQGLVAYQLFMNGNGSLYQLPTQPIIVPPTDSGNDQTSEMTDDNIDEEGLPLPNTATNMYNYLVIGIILLLIGFTVSIKQRKKA